MSAALFLVLLISGAAGTQSPTGTIAGVVMDPSGAPVPGAAIGISNRATGQSRTLSTSPGGDYSAAALPPGTYNVRAEASGFRRLEREVSVEAGTTTTADLTLAMGEVSDGVTVNGATPLLRYDQHQLGGVVRREQIDNLPLNGRNFLELAKLEPGVTNPLRLPDSRVFVSSLGAGLQTIPRVGYTRVTVDGASIVTPSTLGTILQVSQDVVQEFQMSTVNFDPTTSLTSNGAVNIVTRSGGNAYHGSGFSFYRDHNLAAYPALRRDSSNPDPFFQRHQFGGYAGGPIRKDKAFFFTSYERNDQRGVVSVQPGAPEFAALGGIFASPYLGNLFSTRVDFQVGRTTNAFVRHTHDGNRTFASVGASDILPSAWSRRTVRADQTLAAFTSVLSAHVVNDLRASYYYITTPDGPAQAEDCPGCFGLNAPRVMIPDTGLTFGNPRILSVVGRRYQFTESLVWQHDRHRLRFGFDWEHVTNTVSVINQEQITLWSPTRVRQLDPTIPLPASFTTVDDVLQLPLRSVQIVVGPGGGPIRVQDLLRVHASDTWAAGARLTINAGLAWSYEPNALNYDLTKPALLIPILGVDGLNAPAVPTRNVSPTLGFAWKATRDGRTVVRGGAGRYFDPAASSNAVNLDNERLVLLPAGTGRVARSGSNIQWNGRTLDFQSPTTYTGAHLVSDLPGIRDVLLRSLNPNNQDFTVRNIDRTKEGSNLYDPHYATPYAIHVSLGVQREVASGLVVSADLVWKRFIHTYINGIDYNRWNSARGPVLPRCTDEQKIDDRALCSNGSIFFDTTTGRARYEGLLVRVERRLSRGAQFLASYALGSFVGSNGTGTGTSEAPGGRVFGFNNDNWFENYGPLPTDIRHILNVSGVMTLPWGLQTAFTVSASSAPPFSANVDGMDFNGDGTSNDLLPGTKVNQFDRGLDKEDLARLVDSYNQQYANKPTIGGQVVPPVTLPTSYSFYDGFFTQDVRLSRTFHLGNKRTRLTLIAEIFNLLNTANLLGQRGNLASTATFGQPTARSTQIFGSGGPRAVQFGARVSF